MASKQSTARKPKSQPLTEIHANLTPDEVQRLAEKLATALEHDSDDIGLMTLLFDHLEQTYYADDHGGDFASSIFTIKKALYAGTIESERAQQRFQADAYRNRGKLLLWPYERQEAK